MPCSVCGGGGARLYPGGLLCSTHAPATIAGRVVPTPDPELTLVGLRAGGPAPTPIGTYGPAPVTARPHVREGQKTAHLVGPGSAVALCGRPAGRGRARWDRCEMTPDRDNRCRDCDLAMRASNPKSWEPRYWWRA